MIRRAGRVLPYTPLCTSTHSHQQSTICAKGFPRSRSRTRMVRKKAEARERVFSVDLKSSDAIKSAALVNSRTNGVMLEGSIGVLEHAKFVENTVLEVAGSRGVLRVDLTMEDLAKNPVRPEGDDAK